MTNLFSTILMVAPPADGGKPSIWPMIIMMVSLFAIMYFFTIRPEKKRQKMEQEIRDNTQIGDEITTIGGVTGRVVSVKDDSIILETGSDRVKIKFMKYAVATNHTANEKIQAEREASKAAAAEKKSKKSKKNKDEEKKEDKEDK